MKSCFCVGGICKCCCASARGLPGVTPTGIVTDNQILGEVPAMNYHAVLGEWQ